LQFRHLPFGTGSTYQSARLSVRGPGDTAKNRPSAVDFGCQQSIEGEIGKKRKRKKRREENLAPVLAHAPSSPSPAVRQHAIVARTHARRQNVSLREEKDRGDIQLVKVMAIKMTLNP
ncbi:hypothetical protein BHE74_00047846, partial [Ensete ventricosum]